MNPSRSARTNAALFLLAVVVTAWWSQPLWLTAGQTGGNDWGVMLNVWEVRWKTLTEYGQWPAHNPWQGGGLPVNPALGYFSIQAVTTFALGPEIGLSVFILFYLLLGVWGFWRLGRQLFENPVAAFFLAVFGAASPAFAFHLSIGHLIYANFLVWPCLFYWWLRAATDRWAGLKAGVLFALGFNEMAYYIMQYGALILGALWLWRFAGASGPDRVALRRFAALGIAGAVPFMLPSLVGIVTVARDYARVANTPASFTAADLWRAYFVPVTEFRPAVFIPAMKSWWGTWEINCYLGWGAVLLLACGLGRGVRWFHLAAAACFVFTIGNLHWWEPMRWLMETPAFASLQSFNRLRLFTHLFFALGAAWGLAATSTSVRWRPAVMVLAAAALVEVLVVSRRIAARSHLDYPLPAVANERHGAFYQRAVRKPLPAEIEGWPADLVHYVRANVGIARESAAIDSNFRLSHLVRTVDDADYRGEFDQGGRAVVPEYWSPNRIILRDLNPDVPIRINLNRGSPWRNFDRPIFPGDRIVEFQKPFLVWPGQDGTVNLTYVLPGQAVAWWCSLGAFLLSVGFCLYLRRSENNAGGRIEPAKTPRNISAP